LVATILEKLAYEDDFKIVIWKNN